MKIEIELPFEIGTELYWIYKEKIARTKVVKYWSTNLYDQDYTKIEMQRPNEKYSTESLHLSKVFVNKEDLIKYISE